VYEAVDFCRTLSGFVSPGVEYIRYYLNREQGLSGNEPRLDPLWKYLIHRELGFSGELRLPPELGMQGIAVEAERIERLRTESDELRELLRASGDYEDWDDPDREVAAVEQAAVAPKPQPPPRSRPQFPPPEDAVSLAAFIEGLEGCQREALRYIAGGNTAALRDLAVKNRTMPCLILDRINERFMEKTGDLLIETLDEEPAIQAEYREETKKFLLDENAGVQ
jgi:hypothetical protein